MKLSPVPFIVLCIVLANCGKPSVTQSSKCTESKLPRYFKWSFCPPVSYIFCRKRGYREAYVSYARINWHWNRSCAAGVRHELRGSQSCDTHTHTHGHLYTHHRVQKLLEVSKHCSNSKSENGERMNNWGKKEGRREMREGKEETGKKGEGKREGPLLL